MSRKVIIDTDPGVDDAMAILFAFKTNQLDVLGLTTTFGNVSVDLATKNALILTELAGVNVPVAKGVAVPLEIEPRPHADFVHGADGFGNINWPDPKSRAVDVSAAQFIIDSVKANPGEVTLIALGPLGNLATALKMAPEIADLVDEVILMGGAAVEYGNVSPVAEANIINDPHAADIVFTANWQVTMIGLDVTHQVLLTNDILARIKASRPEHGDFLHQAAQYYIQFYNDRLNVDGCFFHDASTVAYAMEPDIFGIELGAIRVACEGIAIGQTIFAPQGMSFPEPHWDGVPMTQVCMEVDSDRLLNLFEKTLS
ncbi:nucleoside hydrolase [Marinomonas algicola]|uniref:nucleoside hydrolase n=1 Tax=Marinomonas algicola TaxID=2773454 RepID=UPI0017499364|nr:nucleoside hydrolase [Marinomonas algicola]